jgi:hypothetical protein
MYRLISNNIYEENIRIKLYQDMKNFTQDIAKIRNIDLNSINFGFQL